MADQRLLARSTLPVEYCSQVTWASDGSAAALVTGEGEVYLWLPDGSQPKKIGEALRGTVPIWSPDNSQILVADWLKGNLDPDILTLNIAYRDGRAMLKPGTEIEAGNQWGLPGSLGWLNSAIIYSRRACPLPKYCLNDYYDARSGRFIIRNTIDELGGREPALSPDEHWLVLEAALRATNWDLRWEMNLDAEQNQLGLIVCDLQTLRRSLVIQSKAPENESDISNSSSLKFLGWNADSRQFYLVHFPVGGPAYNLPTGLLALHPNIGYIQPVVPGVALGLASPDGEHVFLVTGETIEEKRATGLQASIYRMDGTPITALQPLAEQIEYATLNEVDTYASAANRLIPSEWSPDGRRLAFADPQGNLWIMDTTGKTTRIVSGLPAEDWRQDNLYNDYQGTWFSWSTDGQFLLIRRGAALWIAHVVIP